MCGIVGSFDTLSKRPVEEELVLRMRDSLVHRGPDDAGLHIEPGIGLGHRRLSIIDLGGGHQPMYNEDDSVVVVYNGEIYNFQALRQELRAEGHTFRTKSDTEVIVHGWEQWGENCVKRFRGMFAFAIWDRNQQALFLARDRLGIKPLLYSASRDGWLLFGSELKALMAWPGLGFNLEPEAVEDYFAYGYVPDPRTILAGVHKLPPGHTLTVRRGESFAPTRRYWEINFDGNGACSEASAARELAERLRDAVGIRLIADVPLGAFLSGGVDSSAVVAMMAGLSSLPVNTCSIGFDDSAFNETEYANAVATLYKTHHRAEFVNPNEFELLDRLSEVYDEPFSDSSAVPTYRLCELARREVKVALSGDGGDEGFAGYRRYRWHMREEIIRRRLPKKLRRPLFGLLGWIYPKADWLPRILRAKSTFEALARDDLDAYFQNFSILPDKLRSSIYSEGFRRELNGYHAIEVFRGHLQNAPEHPLSRIQYLDFKTYLPGDILTKVDRASMAHSLEVRVPILDHEFIEWVCGLPPQWKLNRGEGKHIFKKSLEPYLPPEILYRPKMGFAVPLASWFRGPLKRRVREVLLGQQMGDCGVFDMNKVQILIDQHQSGARDYSAAIWALLMFQGFQRNIDKATHSVGNGPGKRTATASL